MWPTISYTLLCTYSDPHIQPVRHATPGAHARRARTSARPPPPSPPTPPHSTVQSFERITLQQLTLQSAHGLWPAPPRCRLRRPRCLCWRRVAGRRYCGTWFLKIVLCKSIKCTGLLNADPKRESQSASHSSTAHQGIWKVHPSISNPPNWMKQVVYSISCPDCGPDIQCQIIYP